MLQLLKELGVDDNTIVVFTADNGPEMMTWPDGGTTPFKAEKGTTWEGGFRVPAVVKWPGKIKPGQRTNASFDCKDWFPTLITAAGGSPTIIDDLLAGTEDGYKAHLDGYNQMPLLLEGDKTVRKEVIYYEGTTLQAVRYNDWKAHFIVQNHGWFGTKEKLIVPLLFNLRRDPYEKAAEESGMYIEWLGKKNVGLWSSTGDRATAPRHL